MLAPSVGDNEIAVKPANTKCSLVSSMLSGAVMVELVDPNVIQAQCSVKGGDPEQICSRQSRFDYRTFRPHRSLSAACFMALLVCPFHPSCVHRAKVRAKGRRGRHL